DPSHDIDATTPATVADRSLTPGWKRSELVSGTTASAAAGPSPALRKSGDDELPDDTPWGSKGRIPKGPSFPEADEAFNEMVETFRGAAVELTKYVNRTNAISDVLSAPPPLAGQPQGGAAVARSALAQQLDARAAITRRARARVPLPGGQLAPIRY